MSRAARARRIAATAAFGGGGLGALAGAAYGLIKVEVGMARRWIGQPFGDNGPGGDGVYGAGTGRPIRFAMLGDSSSVGLGVDKPAETPGALMAAGLAAITGRPVHLQSLGVVGAESTDLPGQVADLLASWADPDVAVIMIGANDVTHRVRPEVAVRALDAAVRRLREVGCEVVVGTCPDLGTLEPLAFPLSAIARRSSRQLAAAQTIATVEAGGRTVSLGDLLGPEFSARPKELFSSDGFHPSAAGYARAAETMLPSVAAALGYWPDGTFAADLEQAAARVGERVDDIANAAVQAVDVAGTEVSGTAINGAQRGPRGRWAVLLRRRRASVPTDAVPGPEDNAARETAFASDLGPDLASDRSRARGTTVAGATAAED